jgi:NAD(P)-dependent dehydrogenase (short-subunit alcohol dehydrogenase family)
MATIGDNRSSAQELEGRRVVVTGGASGMGAALVRHLPIHGARVVSLDVNPGGAAVAADSETAFLQCDVASKSSIQQAIESAAGLLGGLDVLVHAAGVAPGGPAEDLTLDHWCGVMAVNATGTFLTNQAVLPHLKRAGGGRIINFASIAGIEGRPGKAAYSASKGAVVAWTRTVAVEWAKFAVTVNALAPAIWTPMYDKTRSAMTPEQLAAHDARRAEMIPLGGRLGDPVRDLVPFVVFLAGEGSRFMTGQTFAVDGGMLKAH